MVDSGEHADEKQPDGDFQGRTGEARQHRADTETQKEDDHHATPTPAVRKPPRRQGEGAESDESGRSVYDELRVAHVEGRRQNQRRHRSINQDEQVIVEMPQVEEKELETIFAGHGPFSCRWTRDQCAPTAARKLTTVGQEMSRDRQARVAAPQLGAGRVGYYSA